MKLSSFTLLSFPTHTLFIHYPIYFSSGSPHSINMLYPVLVASSLFLSRDAAVIPTTFMPGTFPTGIVPTGFAFPDVLSISSSISKSIFDEFMPATPTAIPTGIILGGFFIPDPLSISKLIVDEFMPATPTALSTGIIPGGFQIPDPSSISKSLNEEFMPATPTAFPTNIPFPSGSYMALLCLVPKTRSPNALLKPLVPRLLVFSRVVQMRSPRVCLCPVPTEA